MKLLRYDAIAPYIAIAACHKNTHSLSLFIFQTKCYPKSIKSNNKIEKKLRLKKTMTIRVMQSFDNMLLL